MQEFRKAARAARTAGLAIVASCGFAVAAHADAFGKVAYDPATDELVVTMHYRGTHPNHGFTLKWGRCRVRDGRASTISVEVLDDHWQDAEKHDYVKTTRFSLADLACRPARVTLRTAPRYYTAVSVPAAPQ